MNDPLTAAILITVTCLSFACGLPAAWVLWTRPRWPIDRPTAIAIVLVDVACFLLVVSYLLAAPEAKP